MKNSTSYLLALLGMLALPPAYAADQKALANVKGCPACHEMSTKKVGPPYKEIAKKYAGQKDAADKLVKNVLEGSTGVWGNVPMPANKTTGVTEADARKLVDCENQGQAYIHSALASLVLYFRHHVPPHSHRIS